MPNIPGFLSPRSDLTIRNVPPEKMEALMNAAVDILGGVVQFSETAIYESADTTKTNPLAVAQCSKAYRHPPHRWFDGPDLVTCQGVLIG